MQVLVSKEVHKLIAKQAIKEAKPALNQFLSHCFLVQKMDGSLFPVINLYKETNKRLRVQG